LLSQTTFAARNKLLFIVITWAVVFLVAEFGSRVGAYFLYWGGEQ
jgi:hypothetical protein